MGRSNGYRPKAAVREEVLALRARLAELTDDQWQKASCIMQNITSLLGHDYGPMGGKIEPRACKFCHHFGHTRQWCPKRIAADAAREEREYAQIMAEDEALGILDYEAPDTEWTRWTRLADWAYQELVNMKDTWTDGEWAFEFHKRAGNYDHTLHRINLYQAPLGAAKLNREMDTEGVKSNPLTVPLQELPAKDLDQQDHLQVHLTHCE